MTGPKEIWEIQGSVAASPLAGQLIGTTNKFKIIKLNRRRGNVVLSRRILLEKEREAKIVAFPAKAAA